MISQFRTGTGLRTSRIVAVSTLISMLLGGLGWFLITPGALQAQGPSPIVINEFMSSNVLTLADEDGDFEDWVELHNTGATPVSLAGYGLSDDPTEPFKWVFPDVDIASGAYMLVWASGKDRVIPGHLHTNFSIKAGGETLLLTDPFTVTADQVAPVALMDDISYGRQPDGANDWFFFDQATPGSSNITTGYVALLDPPAFSQAGGFFTEAFSLTLSHAAPGVAIIYTLDGSLPDPDNLGGQTYTYKNQYSQNPGDPSGALLMDAYQTYSYTQPLSIVDRATAPDKLTGKSSTYDLNPDYFPAQPVFKGTVVRARAVMSGALPSRVSTHSFFVTPLGRDRYSLPVISLSMEEDTLFGYTLGIYTAGEDFDAWRDANPTLTATAASDANWHRDSEFEAHLDLFEPDSPALAFGQDMGFRGHGDYSRMRRMKTLRLYARDEYGDSNFEYPFFPDQPYDSYRRLLLRNSGNDFNYTMFRDAAIQTSVAHLNFDTQAYRPSIVFLNGEYWGLHNLRERYDEDYLAGVYGVDPDNVDFLENNANVSEGDAVHYNAMLDYIDVNGLTAPEHYAYIQTQMDVDNYRDYQITEIFIGNTDWPQNNIKYWRSKNAYDPVAPYGQDGRWRWLLFDTDTGLGTWGEPVTTDSLSRATSETAGWPTFLLRNLLQNESFRTDFINRFADLLNTTFLSTRMVSHIEALKQNIAPEMPEHIARWEDPDSLSYWDDQVDIMINYVNGRPSYQRQHIRDKFGIPSDFTLNVDVSDPAQGYVRVNTIELLESTPGVAANPYPWSGVYFQGIPVELEAIPASGYQFVRWEEMPEAASVFTYTAQTSAAVTLTAVFTEATQQGPSLLHYWHFNALLDETFTELPADYTILGDASITYPGVGDGYMDRTSGTLINARMDEPAEYGLRVRNPSDTRELRLTLPTTGYENLVLRYAVRRTGSGAQEETLFYRISETAGWVQFGDTFTITEDYVQFDFDFTGVAGVADNPEFEVQILFGGSNAGLEDGNDRFDNITLEGTPLQTATLQGPFTPGQFYPFGGDIDCGGVTFTSTGTIDTILVTLMHGYPTANHDGLPRHYEITAGGSGYVAQLLLCYTDDELLAAGISDATGLHALRWNGGEWDMFPGAVDTGAKTVTAENVTQFSIWGIGTSTDRPTAVTLHRFGLARARSAAIPYFGVVAACLAIAGWRIWRRRSRRFLINS